MAAFKDSRSEPRTGKDLLLQPVTGDVTVFRAVANDPPTEDDFLSHAAMGLRPRPTSSYRSAAWFAVSMFDRVDTIDRFVTTRAQRGDVFHRAQMRLSAGLGLDVIYNARTGHLDVFGFPEILLGCFETII